MSGLKEGSDDMMTEINMTPLIDVMLVLLIVFMVTLPVIHHAVKIELPQATSSLNQPDLSTIDISIDANGNVAWNGTQCSRGLLDIKMAEVGTLSNPPTVEIAADRLVRYEVVADVLAAAQRANLSKIRFLTEPKSR